MADDPNEAARQAFGDAAQLAGRPPRAASRPRDVPTRQLADWWPRAGAFLLDQLVVAAVVFPIGFAAAAIGGDSSSVALVAYAVGLPLSLLYAPLLMARSGTRNGQTLGKQAIGIRVVRVDGAPMTFATGVLRTLVGQQLPIAITFYLYALVDYLWPLRDPRNQALHDKLAKTFVLRAAAQATPAPAPARWLPPQAPDREAV